VKDVKELSEQAVEWGGKHVSFLKGLGALFFGVLLIYVSRQLFANVIVFGCGVILIYYALNKLKLKKITDFIDKMVGKLKL